jgi:hypothetical protein
MIPRRAPRLSDPLAPDPRRRLPLRLLSCANVDAPPSLAPPLTPRAAIFGTPAPRLRSAPSPDHRDLRRTHAHDAPSTRL